MARKGSEAGPGWPTFIEERPVGYHEKPCSLKQRLPYQSETGGVSPMWLEGREGYMVERMRGMTPERRAYRKQFLQDQILSAREPVHVPELERELYHPLRRFYNYPFKKIVEFLTPRIGNDLALYVQKGVRNWMLVTLAIYGGTYMGLYHIDNWQFVKRISILRTKPVVYPGDPAYPYVSTKEGDDYYDLGFKATSFYKSDEQIRASVAAEQKAKELREARMIRKDYI